MSYLVLARKWRPQRFEDVIGQKAVVKTLRNALAHGRVAHAMIFSGVRGVGKTTLARIMAKAINCTSEDTDKPCNKCQSCREITAGTALDLHEIDGASNRGIQEIRELKEDIRFLPSSSRFKIYIIDEVHMLTTEAFNALLKTLEEPPTHVYFMFATTEIHKVPITILSRCQRYELQRLRFKDLEEHFGQIVKEEKRTISDEALAMITREAAGSVRDGLSLLDQIFSYGDSEIGEKEVTEVLGLVDSDVFADMAKAILAGDLARCLDLLDRCVASGADLKRLANDLLGHFRALMICRSCEQPELILNMSDQQLAGLKETAAGSSAETLYQYFQLLLRGVEEMQRSSQPRMVLEMTFIRLTQAGSITPLAELLQRFDRLAGSGNPAARSETSSLRSVAEPAAIDTEVQSPRGRQAVSNEPADKPASGAGSVNTEEAVPAAASAARKEPELGDEEKTALNTPAFTQALDRQPKDVRRDWDAFVNYVKERKPWMAHVLRLCGAAREDGGRLILRYDSPSDYKVVQEKNNLKTLTEFAQDFFQRELRVQFSSKSVASGSDAEEAPLPVEERRALANDPLVQLTTEVFGGQITNIRTGPRSR
ncbi:MAG: DNA polymerase III subunit gamma/tau [Deltaproteobacteria bacterium]